MEIGLLGQYLVNGLMLGMIYALVAVGFTLFFGVLNVIQFSHGDVLMVGSFVALTVALALQAIGVESDFVQLVGVVVASVALLALLGVLMAKYLVLPLKGAPPLNTLLMTLMLGIVLRESVRLFYPHGANPHNFPALLPTTDLSLGQFSIRVDTLILLLAGLVTIVALHLVINRTRLGLAIRAVSQDEETARTMGINFALVVYVTFAIGSAVAALAGIMQGVYYSQIFFANGLVLGVIGFSAAIVGGLGNIYGAILGGFLFAFLQIIAVVAMPFGSGYKNVFAFAVIIALMAWRPTGLIAERVSEKV